MDVNYCPKCRTRAQAQPARGHRRGRDGFLRNSSPTRQPPLHKLKPLHKACSLRITKLTDNGTESADRLFASRGREPTGNHDSDQLCQELGIEHRLTRPRRTIGMVQRLMAASPDMFKIQAPQP
jgi:hypothetical protein